MYLTAWGKLLTGLFWNLSNIYGQRLKAFNYFIFAKKSILDLLQGSEYSSVIYIYVKEHWTTGYTYRLRTFLPQINQKYFFTGWSEKPIPDNFCKKMSWSVVSKALLKSISIISVTIPLWKPFMRLSFYKGHAEISWMKSVVETRLITVYQIF